MQTTLSSKGQVVLPRMARSRLGLTAGAKLECEVTEDYIVLKPKVPIVARRETVVDKHTGIIVTKTTGAKGRVTTSMVKALMVDFP